jgi:hypothetical protein
MLLLRRLRAEFNGVEATPPAMCSLREHWNKTGRHNGRLGELSI